MAAGGGPRLGASPSQSKKGRFRGLPVRRCIESVLLSETPAASPARSVTASGDWHPGPAGSAWASTVTRGRDHRLHPSPSPVADLIEVESRHCNGAGPHLHRRHTRAHELRTASGHRPAVRVWPRPGLAGVLTTTRLFAWRSDSRMRDSEHRVPSHLSRNIVFRVTRLGT